MLLLITTSQSLWIQEPTSLWKFLWRELESNHLASLILFTDFMFFFMLTPYCVMLGLYTAKVVWRETCVLKLKVQCCFHYQIIMTQRNVIVLVLFRPFWLVCGILCENIFLSQFCCTCEYKWGNCWESLLLTETEWHPQCFQFTQNFG